MTVHLDAYLAAVIDIEIEGRTWTNQPAARKSKDERLRALPALLNDAAIVITAWNPNGVNLPKERNQELNKLLEEDLRNANLEFLQCIGRDNEGTHLEVSYFVSCRRTPDQVTCLKLAHKYSQEAVFKLGKGCRSLLFTDKRMGSVEQAVNWMSSDVR